MLSKESYLMVKEIDIETVKSMLKAQPFMSAVGHESTARVLSKLLDIEIPFSRVPIKLQQRDKLIVFQLRLEEGRVLSEEELKQLQYKFFVVEVVG
jgi:hypothetical protein